LITGVGLGLMFHPILRGSKCSPSRSVSEESVG
jgi:hypothetical protein